MKVLVHYMRFEREDEIIDLDETPKEGEEVFVNGLNYMVSSTKHFIKGGQAIKDYKKYNFPFIRIVLSKYNY